ncbi:ATP-dependent RNA helicase DBP2 [Dictyocoela muelleri]|nr:ATP-dependent RNA helicase DBP2 [Dictyocoela muelleri]
MTDKWNDESKMGSWRREKNSSPDSKQYGDKRSYGDKSYGDKSYGDKSYGDKSYGDKSYGDKSYGDKSYGDKSYGDKSYGDKRSYGDKSYGDKSYGDKRSYGDSGNKSYGDRSGKNYGDFGNKSYGSKGYGDSYNNKNSDYKFESRGYGNTTRTTKCVPVEFEKNFLVRLTNEPSAIDTQKFRKENEMTVKGTDIPSPVFSFTDVEFFNKSVHKTFTESGFSSPTPIQSQGWPMALAGRDMVGIAQTGSGKTLSFMLPALIHASRQEPLKKGDGPIVVVLAPTRELVMQITEVAEKYAGYYKMRCVSIYGGVSAYAQKNKLQEGVEILIATPGRLIDLKDQGYIPLERTTFLVLDEADRMLDMGFEPQLRKIIPETNPNRQTLMWSATWPKEVRELAEKFMKEYIQVNVGCEDLRSNDRIKQIVRVTDERHKNSILMDSLKDWKNSDKIIIFCNKKRTCDYLEGELIRRGFKAVAIHGDKAQYTRDRIIADFKSGKCNILIATDVAARGLDVKDIKVVFNYDFPTNCESYVHRIGRTARGDKANGLAISFITSEDSGNVKELIKILKQSKQEVPNDLVDLVPKYGGAVPTRNFRQIRRRW